MGCASFNELTSNPVYEIVRPGAHYDLAVSANDHHKEPCSLVRAWRLSDSGGTLALFALIVFFDAVAVPVSESFS
jgi:hypothetical protein